MTKLPIVQPERRFDVRPLGEQLPQARSRALCRGSGIKVIRLVLPAGRQMADHSAAGEITLQCLEGAVRFTTEGRTYLLSPGDLLCLPAGQVHALQAIEDSSLLLTIHLRQRDESHAS